MSDKSYLEWPFFEDAHRALERDVEAWAAKHLSPGGHGSDVDDACRALVDIAATSEPESGSDRANAAIAWPAATLGR